MNRARSGQLPSPVGEVLEGGALPAADIALDEYGVRSLEAVIGPGLAVCMAHQGRPFLVFGGVAGTMSRFRPNTELRQTRDRWKFDFLVIYEFVWRQGLYTRVVAASHLIHIRYSLRHLK